LGADEKYCKSCGAIVKKAAAFCMKCGISLGGSPSGSSGGHSGSAQQNTMAFVGNLLWFIFGGVFMGLLWLLIGLIWCATIIGIPIGIACFRIARFAFFPFGKELIPAEMIGEKRIAGTAVMNFLWCIFCGIWLAICHALTGVGLCITIIGIPFGIAHFNLSKACFAPLGQRIVSKEVAAVAKQRNAQNFVSTKLGS
jgi:uncharacterized membrane protein YccF (DUF307 family)